MPRLAALGVGFVLVLAACQPTGTASSPAPSSIAASAPAGQSLPPTSAATPVPTLPEALSRPPAPPDDGNCEDENTSCIGVLEAGKTYHSSVWEPTLTFTVPTSDWVNTFDTGGELGLLSRSAPGDAVMFFREPRAEDPSVGRTIEEIAGWLAKHDQLSVTGPAPAQLGGLKGVMLDIRTAPGATATDPECPVRTCVSLLKGDDPVVNDPYQWHWSWGNAGSEVQRLYLFTAPEGTIAIFVDSLDGATFEQLTEAFDQIAPTISFG